MKKLFLTMAALSAIAAAAPATAQYPAQFSWSNARDERIAQLQDRIERGMRSDFISRSDGSRFLYRLSELRQTKYRYRRGGFSDWERNTVDRALDRLRSEVRTAELYADSRVGPTPAYGWDDNRDRDRDGWDDRTEGVYAQGDAWDRDNDGWDDRDVTVVTSDDDYVGVGGPVELVVGDSAPSDLSGVPVQFQARYPDGTEIYYRYRDGLVYQIDRRTNVILWVGQLPY
jgi:hypothetical protein